MPTKNFPTYELSFWDLSLISEKDIIYEIEKGTPESSSKVSFLCAFYLHDIEGGRSGGDVVLRRVVVDADIFMEDLAGAKKSVDSPFWFVGQPDVSLNRSDDGRFDVVVDGFDYFCSDSGSLESGGLDRVACWFLDVDYDGRVLCPSQIFFPSGDSWEKLGKSLRGSVDVELLSAFTGNKSLPFTAGKYGRVAVKIVDTRGIESMKVLDLGEKV